MVALPPLDLIRSRRAPREKDPFFGIKGILLKLGIALDVQYSDALFDVNKDLFVKLVSWTNTPELFLCATGAPNEPSWVSNWSNVMQSCGCQKAFFESIIETTSRGGRIQRRYRLRIGRIGSRRPRRSHRVCYFEMADAVQNSKTLRVYRGPETSKQYRHTTRCVFKGEKIE
jgi:hypothetical protein